MVADGAVGQVQTSSAAAGAQAAALSALTCTAHTLPVRITDPGPADQSMWGQLYYRGTYEPDTVQLLVHGATYNHLPGTSPTATATTPTSTPPRSPGTPPSMWTASATAPTHPAPAST
jgi:hypothetical protein